MSATYRRVYEVLSRHMSSILSRSVLERALQRARVRSDSMEPSDLPRVVELLHDGVRLFAPPEQLPTLQSELLALCSDRERIKPQTIAIVAERDVSTARMAARHMAELAGCGSLVAQKTATVVSELARNIVNYTDGGEIHLEPLQSSRGGLLIRATDHGAGITNLDEILSGRYRSKTGLGLGLQGTRRIAQRFDVRTGPSGTIVEVEITN